MNNNSLSLLGQLHLMETRGYSAYEVAVINGFEGTEEEWLASLVGPQGPQGPDGRSAYQVAVDNGYIGSESDWVNDFMTPDGYYTKAEVDNKLNKKPYYFDSVAQMKESSLLKEGDMVVTAGYYEVNDGGAALYKIVEEESETEYQEGLENGLYANLIFENKTLNVKQFGAKGNGITDDSNSFINMFSIDAEKYYIPTGNYIVTHNVCNITSLNHNIIIYGDGYNLSNLKLKDYCITEDFQPMFLIQNDSDYSINIEIKDLHFNMNRTNNNLNYEPTGFELQHCHAINLKSTSINGISAIVSNIEFYDCIADGVCFMGQLSTDTFDSIIVENIIATHHIGTRDDVCITGDFNNAVINNCNVDCFEIEVNNYSSDCKHNLIVNNLVTRKRFDIDGRYDIAGNNNPTNYLINNANLTGIIYATSVKAKISNSILNFNGTILRPNHADIEFDNCYINDDFKTSDDNAIISLNNDQYSRITIKNSEINCNNSQYFYYNDTENLNHKKYSLSLFNNKIMGAPSGSYFRITSSDTTLDNNIVDLSSNKNLIYLGTINNSFDINLKNNKLINNGYLFTNSGSLSESADVSTVVNIRSKNNQSDTFGHLINWTNLDKLTPYRGGTGTLYNVIEIDDYEYDRSPNTGKWIKGQKVYNTNPDGTTLGWVCTTSGDYSTAVWSSF